MKPREVQEIYEDACRAASNRPSPEPAQLTVWKQVLGMFDAKDLRGGLALWWRDNVFLPMPADLKPLVEQARRSFAAKERGAEQYSEWECTNCLTRFSSFTPGFTPKACPGIIGHGPDKGKVCGSLEYRRISGGRAA